MNTPSSSYRERITRVLLHLRAKWTTRPAWEHVMGTPGAPRSGREPDASPGFDAYLNGPGSTAPDDRLTEIYIPLKPV